MAYSSNLRQARPGARHRLAVTDSPSSRRWSQVAGLNERLETRKLIDRAKGLLMTLKAHRARRLPLIQRTAMTGAPP